MTTKKKSLSPRDSETERSYSNRSLGREKEHRFQALLRALAVREISPHQLPSSVVSVLFPPLVTSMRRLTGWEGSGGILRKEIVIGTCARGAQIAFLVASGDKCRISRFFPRAAGRDTTPCDFELEFSPVENKG